MGIKGLWNVLGPFSEKKSLHEIHGETVAIDLSGWVCDSQNVTDYYVQPKLYLRNLFFRTIYLLLSDVNPIFVLEGDAPELKRDVMASRNAIQFRGAAPKADTATNKRPDVGRRRFKGVQRECESLLKCMGVCCVKGRGEAEATCAELNAQGLVDAVISQDSDCFAYGARRVYRNFSVSSAAGGGAMQGSIDCYDAEKMFKSNGFGRKKMVALAILCGCDYGPGACGTSITTAVAFLHTVPENDVIPRLVSWVTDVDHFNAQSRWVAVPGRCEKCGHGGRAHTRNGCPVCGTHRGCNDLGHKAKVAEVKRELSLRSRALSCGMTFPEPKVMKEFLKKSPEQIDLNSLKKPAPSLIQFVKLMSHKLDWTERYCVEKFLPLLTKWHLQKNVPCKTIKPVAIKKKRTPRGVPSFEVIWEDIDGQYEALIPDEQYEEAEDRTVPWTSIERQDLMRQFYPELVSAYEESIKKPPKEKKTRGRKKKDDDGTEKPKRKYNKKKKTVEIENVNESLKALEINAEANSSRLNVSVKVNKLKRKIKNTKKAQQKTIDSFIAKKRKKSSMIMMESLRHSFRSVSLLNDDLKQSSTELREISGVKSCADKEKEKDKEVDWLCLLNDSVDGTEENDLSDIVERMILKSPTTKTVKLDNNLVKLVFDTRYSSPKKIAQKYVLKEIHNHCSTPKDSPVRRRSKLMSKFCSEDSLNNSLVTKVNTSYFFEKLTEDRDAFEMSLQHKSAVINLDCDTTLENSLPNIII